jgi:hypothetical protein
MTPLEKNLFYKETAKRHLGESDFDYLVYWEKQILCKAE